MSTHEPDVYDNNQGERMLAEATSPDEYVGVLRFAEAARVYARQANLGPPEIDKASRLAARALLGMAEAVDQGQASGQIRRHGDRSKETTASSLSELGIIDHQLKAGRDLLAAFHRADAILELDGLYDGRAPIIAAARSILTGIEPGQGDDWYTPAWLFEQLDLVFDLDVCAPADPTMRFVPAQEFYTITDNGLAQKWHGLVWCNPPYSTPGEWATRWLEHGNGLLLTHIPANAGWAVEVWQRADAAVWLQAMHFERPNGQTYRPGYALQLAALGEVAEAALSRVHAPKSGSVWKRVIQ